MSTSPKRPWTDRIPLVSWLRRRLRKMFLGMFRKMAETTEGRTAIVRSLDGVYDQTASRPEGLDLDAPSPYANLGAPAPSEHEGEGEGAIFITGRFRSGSTLLWNLFRHMKGFTAYYEPHNERRWFDPATRGQGVDPTHKQVSDYWAEYEGLTALAAYYHEDWVRRQLLMDERSWDADLLAYTRLLLAQAKGRPVLQCNRIDFRLAWHRHRFPAARIVHLYRHPRDQWCSSLLNLNAFPPDGRTCDFERADHFYLFSWCHDLVRHFPFLDQDQAEHPYRLFYFLWKLSYLWGRRYADHSLAMEDLIDRPEVELSALFEACAIDPATQDLGALLKLIERPERGKWRKYAPEAWFQRHEAYCEGVLADFFAAPQRDPSRAGHGVAAGGDA